MIKSKMNTCTKIVPYSVPSLSEKFKQFIHNYERRVIRFIEPLLTISDLMMEGFKKELEDKTFYTYHVSDPHYGDYFVQRQVKTDWFAIRGEIVNSYCVSYKLVPEQNLLESKFYCVSYKLVPEQNLLESKL